jgi:hypothetical protein
MDMDRHDEGDLETQEEWQNLLDDVEITEWPLPPWMMSQSADLYVLNRGCKPRVAKDIPVERLMSMIQAVNRVSSGHQIDHVAKDESESFCLM